MRRRRNTQQEQVSPLPLDTLCVRNRLQQAREVLLPQAIIAIQQKDIIQ